jgi:hypothetical protein
MIYLKRVGGVYRVKVDNSNYYFACFRDALDFIHERKEMHT